MFGDDPDPAGAWRPRAAAIRQKLMRSESDGHCWPTSFPGLAAREAVRRRDLAPLLLSVCDRYRPTVSDFLRHVDELRERSRWDDSFHRARIERVSASRRRLRSRRPRRLPPRPARAGTPRACRPGRARRRSARRPRLRAARVRLARGGRRRRDGGGDGVAERARVGRRGRLGPAPRARTAAAQRGSAALHQAWPLRVPGHACPPSARRSSAATANRRIHPAEAGTSHSSSPRVRDASAVEPAAERRRAGDLRDGLPARLRARPPALPPGVRARARDGGPLDRPRGRLDGSGAHGRDADTCPRRCLAQWAFPAADTLVGMKVAARGFRRRIESCPTR